MLKNFLAQRNKIVDRIQDVLNAQRRPVQFLQDRTGLSRALDDSFAASLGTSSSFQLKRQLEEAHRASGFSPRHVPELHNDLLDPAELVVRGFYCWYQTRWPGRNGRQRYARTVFDLYLIRCLQLLSMRIWDESADGAGDKLGDVQSLLDELWNGAPSDQPVLVRDARWLIPLAQSPTTDELVAYFEVAARVADSLPRDDQLEIQKAHALMIGGHLRSQIRHYCLSDGIDIDDPSVIRRTRTSNALDFALLIQHLASLLEAYEQAARGGDETKRLELAGAVLQAISPDPELFVNRVNLLGAYSMMEDVFVASDDAGHAAYTALGQRHIRSFERYASSIDRCVEPLVDDCLQFRPLDGGYSPYGAIFGTPTNLLEDMALKTLQRDAVTGFGLEDVFTDGDASKLGWVNGWKQLPHVDRDVQKLYEYPQDFAVQMFERIERALTRHLAGKPASERARTGRLFVVADGDAATERAASSIEALPAQYLGSSDRELVAAGKAEPYDASRLLHHRREGYFALSFETSGGWLAVKKDFVTEALGAGRDVKLTNLPPVAAGLLKLMCPGLVAVDDSAA
ncbi:MAG: hypothetical protein R3305_08195, partial [Gammaproteobacteria bacterium]|nr:hypothetical protein [Gammaproteobacteria bacterium]